MTARLAPWHALARTQIGVKEVPGKGDNPTVVQYFADAGIPGKFKDETAWCAAFVGAMLERSGYRGTRSTMAKSYMRWGVPCECQKGAIGVIDRTDDPRFGHVFIIDDFDELYVKPLGGNQANAVNVGGKILRTSVRAFRLPADYNPQPGTPEIPAEWDTTVSVEKETWQETEDRLRDTSRIVNRSDRIEGMAKKGLLAVIVAKLTEWATDLVEPLMPLFSMFRPIVSMLGAYAPYILMAVCAFVVWEIIQIRNARVEDERKKGTATA